MKKLYSAAHVRAVMRKQWAIAALTFLVFSVATADDAAISDAAMMVALGAALVATFWVRPSNAA